MKKKLLSLLLVLLMVLGMFPVSALAANDEVPFVVFGDDKELEITSEGEVYCDALEYDVENFSVTIPAGTKTVYVETTEGSINAYTDCWGDDIAGGDIYCEFDVSEGYECLCMYTTADDRDLHLTINYEVGGDSEEGGIPFAATVGGEEITDITEGTIDWSGAWGGSPDMHCYTVEVPADAKEVELTFDKEIQWSYYDSKGNYVGAGDTSWTSSTEHTVAIQDSNGDGELDGVSVQLPNAYSTEYYIMFVYAEDDSDEGEIDAPFTAEIVGGEKITKITEGTIDWSGAWGGSPDMPCYTVEVPEDAKEVKLTFDEEKQWSYYDSKGNYVGAGDTSWTSSTEHTVAIQDSNGDGELDGISVQVPGEYSAEYYIRFVYEGSGEVEDPCANGHEWDNGTVTTDPTCAKEGVKTFTCDVCGETKTETVEKLDHTYSDETDKCSCGALNPEHEHVYGEYTQTKAPTCTADGSEKATCRCGATDTKIIDAIGHDFSEDEKFCKNNCKTPNPDYVDPNTPDKNENGAYIIETVEDLLWFRDEVNKVDPSISAVLAADIDVRNMDWSPIGNNSNTARFSGTFDGQGHSITFGEENYNTFGLFLYVKGASNTERAVVKNLVIEGKVKGAGVAYSAQFTNFENCINRADVGSDGWYAAGIVADSPMILWNDIAGHVSITNCANEGNITGFTDSGSYTGGIFSYCVGDMIVKGCSNSGNITGSGNVGGIGGYVQGSKNSYITDCYNTGSVTGGGITGSTHNGVTITNCYNAGKSDYAITTSIYNNTAKITNTYWLVSASAQGVPLEYSYLGGSIIADVTSVTATEMAGDEFVTKLGGSFKKSCPAPVLNWQTAKEHDVREIPGVGTICIGCGLGTKQTFDVQLASGTGYTVSGEAEVEEGADYTFTVTIAEGYEKSAAFKVYVNGKLVTSDSDTYVVEKVSGPIKVIVSGVEKIPDSYEIKLPKEGNGYKVNLLDGYTTTVARNGEYKFTVSFANGFKAGKSFAVFVNGKEIEADDGVYTVSNVLDTQVITVEGTEMIPYEGTVTINFTITKGVDKFYTANNGTVIALENIEVPYFDIGLYDLERYYYNPYCYVDKDGNPVIQTAGTPETAYGVITAMHAYIYATEIYYLGMDPEDAGKGFADDDARDAFNEAISWTQGAGSSFLDFWGDGTNLNYYINYIYPLGRPQWGSTSDQIPLNDGDIFSVHFIAGNASGSNFGFFIANDDNEEYDGDEETLTLTVTQGEEVTLTLYHAGAAGNYETGFSRMKNNRIHWIEEENFTDDIYKWNYHKDLLDPEEGEVNLDFANLTSDKLVTDENGNFTFDTTNLAPGTYYIAAKGGVSEGGMVSSDGFVSRGNEAGPAIFKLVVEGPDTLLGDVNGDDKVNNIDATLVLRYSVGGLTEEQLAKLDVSVGDVNLDGKVNNIDATIILRYSVGSITELPYEG